MIKFKEGAEPTFLTMELVQKLVDIYKVFRFHGVECICTCTTGSHGADDPHTHGYAMDFRTRHIRDQHTKERITERLQDILGSLYYVQYEEGKDDPNTPEIEREGEHIHLQVRKDLWRKLETA